MATINTIKIKRSNSAAAPASTLSAGELAYSEDSSKLFYGNIAGNANLILGGKLYTDMLDQTAGTLTASSAILVDSNSKIDNFLVDNLQLNGNQISSSSGDVDIAPAANLDIDAGTIDLSTQATQFTVIDNSATSMTIAEGNNTYITIDTTNSAERILFSKNVEFDGVVNIDGSIDLDGLSDFGGYATTNINIDSGAIDGTPIGANSASTGAFTTLSASSTATLSGNTTVGGTLGVTGVATFTTHAVFGDSDIIKLGDASDLTLYHDGTNSYITNATGALKLATETSGIAVTIGHTTSETTVADNLTVSGDAAVTGTLGVTGVATLSSNATVGGTLGVTGVISSTTHIDMPDSANIKLGTGDDLQLYHDGTNSYITNSEGALKLATETSGIAVTIGHSTSETTVADNLTVAGDAAVTGTLGVTGATTVAAITASGTATLNGNVVLGNAAGSDTVTAANVTTHTGQYNLDNLRLDGNTISSTDSNGNITLSPHGTGTVTVPSSYKDRSGFGSNSLATKEYVDAVKTGLDVKSSCTMATTADLSYTYSNGSSGVGATLTASGNGAVTIDGIATATANQRILVKDQDDAEENGIYYVSTASGVSATLVLTRTTDADTATEFNGGAFTFVEQGTTNADSGWVMTQDSAITFGTTEIDWSLFSLAGSIMAGDALQKSGNVLNWADDNITLEVSSDTARIKGITATAVGDLLIGAASNAGYTALAKAAANNSFLTMGTAGTASWTTTIDGGTF